MKIAPLFFASTLVFFHVACLPPFCGDFVLDQGEACDLGNRNDNESCTEQCTLPACGDGFLSTTLGETCDDQNITSGDGCSAQCLSEAGFLCTGSPSVCAPICGDGIIIPNEQCDDNNNTANDGCNVQCLIEPGFSCAGEPSVCEETCGNGVIDVNESCDDGNVNSDDGCNEFCALEIAPGCNNGVVELNEACFLTEQVITDTAAPLDLQAKDINNDGFIDLISAVFFAAVTPEVHIVLGGAAGFGAPTHLPVNSLATSVTVDNLDGDGFFDIILPNRIGQGNQDGVNVFFGNGPGTFDPFVNIPQDNSDAPIDCVVFDLDGDTLKDISCVTTGTSNANISIAQATPRQFASTVPEISLIAPNRMTVGDIDNDGDLDIIVAQFNNFTIAITKNNGDATFGTPVLLDLNNAKPTATILADLDNDQDLDIVSWADSAAGADIVAVFFNDGQGNFDVNTRQDIAVGDTPRDVVAADLDRNGFLDLAVTAFDDDAFSLIFNDGVNLTKTQDISTQSSPFGIIAEDLNNDSFLDIAVANSANASLSVFLNQP
jgi:cysteine-rich repeat protein